MQDITEKIDEYCNDIYGHRNWEYYDKDNKDKYLEKVDEIGIGIFKTPHNTDGDCLCKDINDCIEDNINELKESK